MLSYMADVITTDCPNYDPITTDDGDKIEEDVNGAMTTINTLTGEAECECGETWTYGAAELLEILKNLED